MQSTVLFNPGGKIPRYVETGCWNAQGKLIKGKNRKQGFLALTLRKLPQTRVCRFMYPCDNGPEPTEQEFQKFRRLLLGTARRRLMAEQVRRIKKLEHLPGRGRIGGIKDNERNEIRKEFLVLKRQLTDEGENAPATTAAQRVAERHGCKIRNIWKILSREH
jgi:hypothetical protein